MPIQADIRGSIAGGNRPKVETGVNDKHQIMDGTEIRRLVRLAQDREQRIDMTANLLGEDGT